MDHINIASVSQEHLHVQSKIDDFFDRFRIGTLLHRCGFRKRHGHSVRSLTQAIFILLERTSSVVLSSIPRSLLVKMRLTSF